MKTKEVEKYINSLPDAEKNRVIKNMGVTLAIGSVILPLLLLALF